MEKGRAYFIGGIDTDAGKTYATGVLASRLMATGFSVVTQKLVQTGCGDDMGSISEDIVMHRSIMGTGLLPEDTDGTTCPQKFTYPASPDLAARLESRRVDLRKIGENTAKLLSKYDIVLIEGAGGLMAPLRGGYTMLDWVTDRKLPLVLVTNPKLGSVNHTLLSLEACRSRGIELEAVLYNHHPVTSDIITADTRDYIKKYLSRHFPESRFEEVPFFSDPAGIL
ncbi:MAG: dethiobiotin synthase [Rikenellaceae bacterium]|nr:dethiobiotin synthase [Rikenellaceae bacterium]